MLKARQLIIVASIMTSANLAFAKREFYDAPQSMAACKDRRPAGWPEEQCLRARKATEIFYRLMAATGLDTAKVRIVFNNSDEVNGRMGHYERLEINGGLLIKPIPMIMEIMSHEIGHWIQMIKGIREEKIRRHTSEQLEAQADWLGVRLAARAGYAPQLWLYGHARVWGCKKTMRDQMPFMHPLDEDRWVNIKSKLNQLESWAAGRREDLKATPEPIVPGSPRIFKEQGDIARGTPVTQDEAVKQCKDFISSIEMSGAVTRVFGEGSDKTLPASHLEKWPPPWAPGDPPPF